MHKQNRPTPVLDALRKYKGDIFVYPDDSHRPYLRPEMNEAMRDHHNWYPETFALGEMLLDVWESKDEICYQDCPYYYVHGCKVMRDKLWEGNCPVVASKL